VSGRTGLAWYTPRSNTIAPARIARRRFRPCRRTLGPSPCCKLLVCNSPCSS